MISLGKHHITITAKGEGERSNIPSLLVQSWWEIHIWIKAASQHALALHPPPSPFLFVRNLAIFTMPCINWHKQKFAHFSSIEVCNAQWRWPDFILSGEGNELKASRVWPRVEYPSCRHTTVASVLLQESSHTVPHTLFIQISTLPSFGMLPPTNRTSSVLQGATIVVHCWAWFQYLWLSMLLQLNSKNLKTYLHTLHQHHLGDHNYVPRLAC